MNTTSFTASQTKAITLDHPQILVVAGPGSGKTTVLTRRINRLIAEGDTPGRMAVVSFTNKAAANLNERLQRLHMQGMDLDSSCEAPDDMEFGFCGTLHGFALRMLKKHGGKLGYGARTSIIDADAAQELLTSKAKSLGCKTAMTALVALKQMGRPLARTSAGERIALKKDELVLLAYFDELREAGIVDFDLILSEFLRLLRDELEFRNAVGDEFEFLFVDEVQDSATMDWLIYRELPIANKFLVGDPDQAIFGFRGGRQDLMLQFSRHERTEVITLEENFRCCREVCESANTLIERNVGRLPKRTVAADLTPIGRVTVFGQTLNEGDEQSQVVGYIKHILQNPPGALTGLKPEGIAILARSNHVAAGFREAVAAAGLPVMIPPKPDLPPDWALGRALIELLAQPDNDTLAFFYFVAKKVSTGHSPVSAREYTHRLRLEANREGETINGRWLHFPAKCELVTIAAFMDRETLSLETKMLINEKLHGLPVGSTVVDLALEIARMEKVEFEEPVAPAISITTIHAAKGREWDAVFLVGFEQEGIPGMSKTANIEEERRVAFVGITRARTCVFFSHAANRKATWGYKPLQPRTPSQFIAEATP